MEPLSSPCKATSRSLDSPGSKSHAASPLRHLALELVGLGGANAALPRWLQAQATPISDAHFGVVKVSLKPTLRPPQVQRDRPFFEKLVEVSVCRQRSHDTTLQPYGSLYQTCELARMLSHQLLPLRPTDTRILQVTSVPPSQKVSQTSPAWCWSNACPA